MENKYIITQTKIKFIIKFLRTRPYVEVVSYISILNELPKLDQKINYNKKTKSI